MQRRYLIYAQLFLGGLIVITAIKKQEHIAAWLSDDSSITTATVHALPVQVKSYPQTKQPFTSTALSPMDTGIPPVVCHVQIVDLEQDGKSEVLICDTQQHAVILGSYQNDKWTERIIANDLRAPARVHLCDIDKDGDQDIFVAELGDVFPNDTLVGSIILLRNDKGNFTKHTILEGLGRVADVRSADFNSDGLLDLVVAEFGHGHGRIRVLQQTSPLSFTSQVVLEGPGAIHVPVADFNNDGLPDFACVLSQDEEEVWVFYNTSNINIFSDSSSISFNKKLVHQTLNDDFGSSGLVSCDIDRDGDIDLLLPHGDNLEEFFHYPQAYHGCVLLENNGDATFTAQRISDLPGCYAAATGDIDNDGHIDVMLVSMVNDWRKPNAASVIMLKHDGKLGFTPLQIASSPIGFITCAIGDINNDGHIDMLAGSFRIQPPFDRSSRLHTWLGE